MYGNSHTMFLKRHLQKLIDRTGAPLKIVVRAEPRSNWMIRHLERVLENKQNWAAWDVKPDYVILQVNAFYLL